MVEKTLSHMKEYIAEIRYTPNPKVLDYRGTWVEMVKRLMQLPKWRIIENRIDVHDENETMRAFVSFRNSGLVVQDSPTRNYFPDQAIKLMRFLLQQEAFGTSITVPRLGVRLRAATAFDGSFSELLERYTSRYLTLSSQAQGIIGAKTIDIGASVNFTSDVGRINTTCGPMEEKQLKQYFPTRREVPSVALYIDLDYYKEPNTEMSIGDISGLIKRFSEDLWDIQDKLSVLVLS